VQLRAIVPPPPIVTFPPGVIFTLPDPVSTAFPALSRARSPAAAFNVNDWVVIVKGAVVVKCGEELSTSREAVFPVFCQVKVVPLEVRPEKEGGVEILVQTPPL
jgi:hypothetical protein